MIFVTVGTHEQQFNRLISYIDELKGCGIIQEEVIMQIGFSTYEPKHCKWSKLLTHKDLKQYVEDARIVITHGGPASFVMPLQYGKIPVVVPRKKEYGEHVNDHQVDFCEKLAKRMGNIILVDQVEKIRDILNDYDAVVKDCMNGIESNNAAFCKAFSDIVDGLFQQ